MLLMVLIIKKLQSLFKKKMMTIKKKSRIRVFRYFHIVMQHAALRTPYIKICPPQLWWFLSISKLTQYIIIYGFSTYAQNKENLRGNLHIGTTWCYNSIYIYIYLNRQHDFTINHHWTHYSQKLSPKNNKQKNKRLLKKNAGNSPVSAHKPKSIFPSRWSSSRTGIKRSLMNLKIGL